jgi:hypothetical protein
VQALFLLFLFLYCLQYPFGDVPIERLEAADRLSGLRNRDE